MSATHPIRPCAEFPNDNAELHAGSRWHANAPLGAVTAVLPEVPCVVFDALPLANAPHAPAEASAPETDAPESTIDVLGPHCLDTASSEPEAEPLLRDPTNPPLEPIAEPHALDATALTPEREAEDPALDAPTPSSKHEAEAEALHLDITNPPLERAAELTPLDATTLTLELEPLVSATEEDPFLLELLPFVGQTENVASNPFGEETPTQKLRPWTRAAQPLVPLQFELTPLPAQVSEWTQLTVILSEYLMKRGHTRASALITPLLNAELVDLSRLEEAVVAQLQNDGVACVRGTRVVSSPSFRSNAHVFREELANGGLDADEAMFWLVQLMSALMGNDDELETLEQTLRDAGVSRLLERAA